MKQVAALASHGLCLLKSIPSVTLLKRTYFAKFVFEIRKLLNHAQLIVNAQLFLLI